MAFDWNTWASNLNRQALASGKPGAEYYLNRPTAGGGSESYRDPLFSISNPDYAAGITSGLGKPVAGATGWSSQEPGAAFYSPTGSDWQAITAGMLNDPNVAQAVMKGAVGGQGAGAFGALKSQIPAGVTQGITGSQNALAPEILKKMWR